MTFPGWCRDRNVPLWRQCGHGGRSGREQLCEYLAASWDQPTASSGIPVSQLCSLGKGWNSYIDVCRWNRVRVRLWESRGWWENGRMGRKAGWKGRGGLHVKGIEGEKEEVEKEVPRTAITHFASFLSKTRPECDEVSVSAFLKTLMWTEILGKTPFLLLARLSCLRSRTAWEVLGVKVVQEFQRQSKLFRCMPICIASGLNRIKLWLL